VFHVGRVVRPPLFGRVRQCQRRVPVDRPPAVRRRLLEDGARRERTETLPDCRDDLVAVAVLDSFDVAVLDVEVLPTGLERVLQFLVE